MADKALAAIVLAAGQGTRMKSDRAKVLHEIGGEPLYSYPVRVALELGANPVVLVVGHQAEAVEADARARFGNRVQFALQAEQLGTGHAVMLGMKPLENHDGNVLILSGDVPLLTRETVAPLMDSAQRSSPLLVALTMILADAGSYGRMVRDADGRPTRVVEFKDASAEQKQIREANAGVYLMDAAFLRASLTRLKNTNAQREYYLTDLIEMAAVERRADAIPVANPADVLGINNRRELAEIGSILFSRTRARLMDSGVTLVDPSTTYISPSVEIGRDTIVDPSVTIRGQTKIGVGCRIEFGCVISDSVVADGVHIAPYTVIESARVDASARVGPFSRLRPGADVGPGAHVGNFVELKNTRLGSRAKANHLAYLGDADVGADSNVGAGTITCNYDGFGKYKTQIGEGVFIGSNSTLVAPLEIGARAYVAAGSTITKAVNEDALSFGRAQQVDKNGRAPELRARAKAAADEAKKKKART